MKKDYNIVKKRIFRLVIVVFLIIGLAFFVGCCDIQELEQKINASIQSGDSGEIAEIMSNEELTPVSTYESTSNVIPEDNKPTTNVENEEIPSISDTKSEEIEFTKDEINSELKEALVGNSNDNNISNESNTNVVDERSKYSIEMATYPMYATTAVNIRTQKNTTSDKIGLYKDGDEARVITNDNGWEVVIYNGQIGFAKGNYFVAEKPVHNEKELKVADRGIDPTKPMVAFTFDDGPNPNSTPRILDVFEKNNVVATFFDLGYLVERYPEVTKREEAIGCEIGNHSYNHSNFNKLSAASMKADMEKSEAAFEKVLGHKTTLFRPPYGNDNNTVKNTLDYPLIRWNVDTLDWKSRNRDKIIAKVRAISNLDGCIVLMHSIYGTTADAVEVLVPELINKGYQFVTVSELAYYRGYSSLRTGVEYFEFKK